MDITAWIELDAALITRHLTELLAQAHCQNILWVTPHPVEWQTRLTKQPDRLPVRFTVVDARHIEAALAARTVIDAIVAVDCHEHFPQAARPAFHRLLTQHSPAVLQTAPLGTDLQILFYHSLSKQHRETFGQEFEPLAASLRFGLPAPEEIFKWIDSDAVADIYYSGDVDDFYTQAERLLNSSRWHRFLKRLTERALSQPLKVQPELHLLETVPMRRHRRFYVYSFRK